MAMMSGNQYRESLRKVHPQIYYMGRKVDSVMDEPAFIPHVNAAAMTYDFALKAEFEELGSTKSHLTGEKINFFTHVHQSTDDLIKKIKLLRAIGQQTASCFQRCVGHDGLNACYSITYEIDQKKGTDYHQRFRNFLKKVQSEDLMITGAMTDAKGDRGLKPSEQKDPDLFVHMVDKNEKGIFVSGAKLHITGAVNAHGHLVMPTTALKPEDAAYAVAFYVPIDAPGLMHIFGRQTNDDRKSACKMDQGNQDYGIVGGEALVAFDKVFVPWENVFMCGEVEFAGEFVERFATAHRQNYGACKTGLADVLIGATYDIATVQNTISASHVKDKLVDMVFLAETLYCCSIACSALGTKLPAGNYMADRMLANITKLNVTKHIYEMGRLAQDITGGVLATTPSEFDIADPKLGPIVLKYMKSKSDVPATTRIRLLRLIEGMTCGTALVESMHGAGSPQAQRIMIGRQANFERKKALAERIAKIGTPCPGCSACQ